MKKVFSVVVAIFFAVAAFAFPVSVSAQGAADTQVTKDKAAKKTKKKKASKPKSKKSSKKSTKQVDMPQPSK